MRGKGSYRDFCAKCPGWDCADRGTRPVVVFITRETSVGQQVLCEAVGKKRLLETGVQNGGI